MYNCYRVSGDLGSLAGLTQLTSIDLRRTSVTGSIESLAQLTQLESLKLNPYGSAV
eukprot:COSAG02_NODE_5333_length_4430_cov_2.392750_1_plen_55_part_10